MGGEREMWRNPSTITKQQKPQAHRFFTANVGERFIDLMRCFNGAVNG